MIPVNPPYILALINAVFNMEESNNCSLFSKKKLVESLFYFPLGTNKILNTKVISTKVLRFR